MTNPFAPPIHFWESPKLSGREIAALKTRWDGKHIGSILKAPPFDRTPENRIDLRYVSFRTDEPKMATNLERAQMRNCDFTGANLHWTIAEHCLFENCIFDRATMTQFSDKGCMFNSCAFTETDMRYASLGSDWNTSKPGEYESTYRDCLFQDMKLAKLLVQEPVFINSRFVFRRLKTVDWGSSGFWGCSFEGAFEDMQFRGEYDSDNVRARKVHPEKAGLHATTFRDAKLRWIDVRDHYPLDMIEMPADGDAFIANPSRIVADTRQIVAACPDEQAKKMVSDYIEIISTSKRGQPKSVVSRYDLFEPDELENETFGTWIYRYLKEHYRAG